MPLYLHPNKNPFLFTFTPKPTPCSYLRPRNINPTPGAGTKINHIIRGDGILDRTIIFTRTDTNHIIHTDERSTGLDDRFGTFFVGKQGHGRERNDTETRLSQTKTNIIFNPKRIYNPNTPLQKLQRKTYLMSMDGLYGTVSP